MTATIFCTCHDSIAVMAVMACAKFCSDLCARSGITTKWILWWIWMTMEKKVSKTWPSFHSCLMMICPGSGHCMSSSAEVMARSSSCMVVTASWRGSCFLQGETSTNKSHPVWKNSCGYSFVVVVIVVLVIYPMQCIDHQLKFFVVVYVVKYIDHFTWKISV